MAGERDQVVLPFVDVLDEAFIVLVPEGKRFRRRNHKSCLFPCQVELDQLGDHRRESIPFAEKKMGMYMPS